MSFFVGLWPIISHYTTGLVITGAFIAVALLTTELGAIPGIGPLLAKLAAPIRTWAIVAAVASVIGLIGYSMGVKNESDRCKAQFVAAKENSVKIGTRARTRAAHDAAGGVLRDPQDIDSN